MIGYATCPETITSPAPSAGAVAIGLKPNMRCGARIPIYAMGPMGVLCQCPFGHHVHVMPENVEQTAHMTAHETPPDDA